MDEEIISRYLGQPAALPPGLRSRIEAAFGGEPVQLYGLAYLDPKLQLKSHGSLSGQVTSRLPGPKRTVPGTCKPSNDVGSAPYRMPLASRRIR